MSQLNDIETEINIERQFQNIRRRLQSLSFGNVIMKEIPFIFKEFYFRLTEKKKLKLKNCSYRRMEKIRFLLLKKVLNNGGTK
jgi:hypothetical protein